MGKRIISVVTVASAGVLLVFSVLVAVALFGTSNGSLSGTPSFAAVVAATWLAFDRISATRESFRRTEVWFLMLFCLTLHVALIRILPAVGQIDGAMTWDPLQVLRSMQSGRICFMHDARNQGWCNYEVLMSALAALFGGELGLGRLFQSVCCVAAIFPVYRQSMRIAGRRFARLVALTMGMSPTLIMYSMVLTSEYLSASLMAYAMHFFIEGCRCDNARSRMAVTFGLAGGILAFSDMFKVIGIIFLVAAFIFVIFELVEKPCRSSLLKLIMVGLIFYPAYKVTRSVGQHVFSEAATRPILVSAAGDSNPLLYELVLGLNVADEGYYSGKLAKQFLALKPEAREKFAVDRFKADWKKYPDLMVKKFRNIHGSTSRHHGSVSTFKNVFRDQKGFHSPRWVTPLADAGSACFVILFVLGSAGLLVMSLYDRKRVLPGIFAALIILEFAVIEQLIEGHGRYKTSIYPFYFLVIAYCRAWFEADNPLCRFVMRVYRLGFRKIKERQ